MQQDPARLSSCTWFFGIGHPPPYQPYVSSQCFSEIREVPFISFIEEWQLAQVYCSRNLFFSRLACSHPNGTFVLIKVTALDSLTPRGSHLTQC